MPFPLVAMGILGASSLIGAGANLYSQAKQRELYRYQRAGYERQYADYKRRLHGREIKYPEFSFPGRIRALDTGISQSYAGSVGSVARLGGQLAHGYGYARSSGLFGKVPSRTSRWL